MILNPVEIPDSYKLRYNPILNTDSYKLSHYLQYPPGTKYIYSYIESRGGLYDYTVLFGLQYYIKEYLTVRIEKWMIDEAEEIALAHGEPFNREGWEYIIRVHKGKLPLRIKAVKEGTVVPVGNALVSIVNTDPNVPWLTSYVEPSLLRGVWYGTTVATLSRVIKEIFVKFYDRTVDEENYGDIDFMLHNFGDRGVSSYESSAIGAMAHATSFKGTDCINSIRYLRHYYNFKNMLYSVPAAEHSSITSWGRNRELDAYKNMLVQFGGKDKIVSVVSDSYDIEYACSTLWGKLLKAMIIETKTKLVIRPDSGDPVKINRKLLKILAKRFGVTVNSKGFKVINNVKLLQGDGVNETSIEAILTMAENEGFASSNFVFGMGGALMQGPQRDTQKWAMKASAAYIEDGEIDDWIDVYKDPITDAGKRSKKGRVELFFDPQANKFETFRIDEVIPSSYLSVMDTVFLDGDLYNEIDFDIIWNNTQIKKAA